MCRLDIGLSNIPEKFFNDFVDGARDGKKYKIIRVEKDRQIPLVVLAEGDNREWRFDLKLFKNLYFLD